MTLVLASGSAVRRRLLAQAGLCFTVDVADVDESPREGEPLFARGRRLARDKALAVSTRRPEAWVIGSDQVGQTDAGVELHKCWSAAAAGEQLMALSGCAHTFLSAAALVQKGQVVAQVEEEVRVRFRTLTQAAVDAYKVKNANMRNELAVFPQVSDNVFNLGGEKGVSRAGAAPPVQQMTVVQATAVNTQANPMTYGKQGSHLSAQ